MERKEWLKQLKAGDDVVVSSWNWVGCYYTKQKVERITPTGFIRVNNVLYRPQDGMSRQGQSELLDPTDEKTIRMLKEYNEKKFVHNIMNKIRSTNYDYVTYDQAVQISKIMGWDE